MRAISFEAFGGPEVLQVVEIPRPDPTGTQVRVAVRAAGVNPIDWKIRSGAFAASPPKSATFAGLEIAGVVDAIGPDATDFAVGDEVFGWSTAGYAEYAIGDGLVAKPAGVAWVDAVALPVAVQTASRVLGLLEVKPGETLLIDGAAGAVGSVAVQLASAEGVSVIGTASSSNQETVRGLGATPTTYGTGVADRVRALAPNGIDAVFDASGHGGLPAAIELRCGTDRIVTIADPQAAELGVTFSGDNPGPRPFELLRRVAELLADGEFRLPGRARVFPLIEAAAAQQESEHGHGRGKVVLTVA